MGLINRRDFLSLSAAAGLHAVTQPAAGSAVLQLHPERLLVDVPENFVGLSLETEQIDRLSPHNRGLAEQFRAIAPRGILRLGGNSSDSAYWQPATDSSVPPRRPAFAFGTPTIRQTPQFPVTRQNIQQLRGFLDAAGWTCIYGINLATNFPSTAVEEAVAVTNILGPRLECLQIGNEADRYGINLRRDPKTWGPQAFMEEWLTFAGPIAARLPHVRFGLPDLAAKPEWFAATVESMKNSPLRERIATLSYHYYIDGPASNPQMNIPNMLHSSAGVVQGANVVRDAATALRTKWSMTEGNTCYSGGKPGVSDVFASALWSADYYLLLASMGCAGINLHGGVGKPVPALQGAVAAADADTDAADMHPHPFYTPIGTVGDHYVAEPVSYGMRFANHFAGTRLMAVDFAPGPVNATAYAALLPNGQKLLAIINKDMSQPMHLDTPGYIPRFALRASSPEARTAELVELNNQARTNIVPPSTAMLFQL